MKAVIPAAGLGTRFLPYTKAQPKEMIPVVDKPAIQYVVEEALASGLRDILIVTGRAKRAIEDHFDANIELEGHLARAGKPRALEELKALMAKARIVYVRQPAPEGLGAAIRCAESFVGDEAFAILLGDDILVDSVPCTRTLLDAHERLKGSVLAVQDVGREAIGQYGMVIGEEFEPGVLRVRDVVEKPSPAEVRSSLATIGRYVLSPTIFPLLREVPAGRGGEVQLSDAIRKLLGSEDVYAVVFPGRRYDVGDKIGWLIANVEMALAREDVGPLLREHLERSTQTRTPGRQQRTAGVRWSVRPGSQRNQ